MEESNLERRIILVSTELRWVLDMKLSLRWLYFEKIPHNSAPEKVMLGIARRLVDYDQRALLPLVLVLSPEIID